VKPTVKDPTKSNGTMPEQITFGEAPAEQAAGQDELCIIALEVSAFKGVRAVKWHPDPTMAVVSGKNGAGKSSVLDGIMACLTSGKKLPEEPIRKGYKKATCCVTLGRRVVDERDPEAAYRIVRTWTPSGGKIEAFHADGTPVKDPSAWLGRMFNDGGCDPLAFSQATPAEQRDTLIRVTGLDLVLADLDAQRGAALRAKHTAETELRLASTSLDAIPETDGPDQEVSVAELLSKAAEAAATNETNRKARQWLADQRSAQANVAAEIKALEAKIAELRDRGSAIQKQIDEHDARIAAMQDADVEAIQRSIQTIESDNAKARTRAARRRAIEARDIATKAVSAAAKSIEDIDARRRLAIEEAPMPVKGLAFEDSAVTFNKVPLAQVNSAMQMRVGVALALAEKKPIRVIFTRYGSLLDQDGLRELREIAVRHHAQVFVERVSDEGGDGLCIVEGEAVSGGAA